MTPRAQRQARLHQGKKRGDRRSYKTELENVQMLLAWEASELSEGQMVRALRIDRVSLRMMREGAIASGVAMAGILTDKTKGAHDA